MSEVIDETTPVEGNLGFEETPFAPKHEILVGLCKNIDRRHLSFHPFLCLEAINKEVERQLKAEIEKAFRDVGSKKLAECAVEIKSYVDEEEKSYLEFQKKNLIGPIVKSSI